MLNVDETNNAMTTFMEYTAYTAYTEYMIYFQVRVTEIQISSSTLIKQESLY